MARIPNHQLIAIAAASGCAMKGVQRYSKGELRRASTITSIEEGLRQLHLEHLLRPQGTAPAEPVAKESGNP